MKYWDYEDYEGSLEDAIHKLIERGMTIRCVAILKYATRNNAAKQLEMFPIRALILYNS